MSRRAYAVLRWRHCWILSLLLLAGCQQDVLLHNLEEQQANEVVDALARNNVQATKADEGKGHYRVDVERTDFPQAVEIITQYALPSSKRVQVANAFPADALVSTPLGERARLYSAIEQRLEESLGALGGVRQARVNVSYPSLQGGGESSLSTTPKVMRLSALLTVEPGVDEVALVQTAKRFLRNTFPDVDYDDISIVTTAVTAQRFLNAEPPVSVWQRVLPWLLGLAVVTGVVLALLRFGSVLGDQAAALIRRLRPEKKRGL